MGKTIAAGSNWLNMKSKVITNKSVKKKTDLRAETVILKRREIKKQKRQAKVMQAIDEVIDPSSILAMDCEMVGVGAGGDRSVLARCSIVNYDGEIVYDQIVRPMERVTGMFIL